MPCSQADYPRHTEYGEFLGSVPDRFQGGSYISFNRLVIGRLKKPERYAPASNSHRVNEIIQTAVGFLPALETILGRDVSVTDIEPS